MDYSYRQYILDKVSNENENRFKEIFIEGLNKKGFFFQDEYTLEKFCTHGIHCEQLGNQKTYFVLNIPFLLYIQDTNITTTYEENKIMLNANFGNYKFL